MQNIMSSLRFWVVLACGLAWGAVQAESTTSGASPDSPAAPADFALVKAFEKPGAEYRGKPFWSWNGELEKGELIRQIGVIKEMGFGGFFMHSRTGLATEYLGDQWFDLINACADEAKKQGLEAWLYDEDRWPSGSAGGKATVEPKYRMRSLCLKIVPAGEFKWDDGLVAAFSCKLDGLNYTDCRRLRKDTPAAQYAGKTVLAFAVELMEPHPFYNGNAYLDTLNREAVDHFIHLTHEEYKKRCGDRLGTSIKGIFTDEPHRGMVMCENVGQSVKSESKFATPWTDQLVPTFQKRFGYDLTDHLPELFLRPEGQRIQKVKWQYMEHIQQMFLDNWAKPLQDWCHKNNMLMTGHVLHEDSLGAQAVPNGSLMRYYEYMDYPGVDVLTEGNNGYWIVKQLASAARQQGQKGMLSELYGVCGWQMNFESHKAVGAWQTLFGINLRCPHLSWYTMEGEAKRDYPASILHQSTWYPDYPTVEDYFSRCHVAMTQGTPICDLLIVNPVESAWAQIYPGWATWLGAKAPEVTALDQKYQQLFLWLCGAQLDFDYGDEDQIKRLSRIEKVDGKPVLYVGKAAYRTVLVSGLETIRSTTLDVLDQFRQAGGTVIFFDAPPAFVDAEASDRATKLAGQCRQAPFTQEAVTKACLAVARRPVAVVDAKSGEALSEIFCQARQAGDRRFFLALNVNREKGFENARIRIEGNGAVEVWDCQTGKRSRVQAERKDGGLEFAWSFAPSGMHLFAQVPAEDPTLSLLPTYTEVKREALVGQEAGLYRYTLDEPNLCVLDTASYRVDNGEWQAPVEILKADRAVRKQLGIPFRGGEMLQPWFVKKGAPKPKAQIGLRFTIQVETLPKGKVYLLAERPDVLTIKLNGTPLPASSADGWMIDPAFKRLPIPEGALKTGENVFELTGGFHEGVNPEAIYLAGDFGVRLDGSKPVVTTLPGKLKIGTVTDQGLPFYTGRIRYLVDVLPKSGGADERVFLATPQFEGACVQVRRGKAEAQPIAWQPRETDITDLLKAAKSADGKIQPLEIEVVLTRRNTFGPLHMKPLKAAGYGPDSWLSTGDGFSETYMLYPSGLLEKPEVIYRKAGK